jgi:V8-like Glu-specific endopeptidase
MGQWRLALLVVAVAGALMAATSPAAATSIPTATTAPGGIPTVGPVFPLGIASTHECTGAVVRSDRANLVLTAAHCLGDNGSGVAFAPGYHDGQTPFGVWNVAAVYADPRWIATQDPQYDYAVMAVVPDSPRKRRLGDLVGGGWTVGLAPRPGQRVDVPAYAEGSNDEPFWCEAPAYSFAGFPAFDCHGYVGGTSGAPWLTRDRGGPVVIRGVIGGLHHGGCVESTSYSPRFTAAVQSLVARAARGAPSDRLPVPGGDGC